MSNSRIPVPIAKFNAYIRNTDDYQLAGGPPTNATRLGISSTDSATWHTDRGAWDILYAKYIDKNQVTPSVKNNVRNFIRDFRIFAIPLIDIMAASAAATQDDANAFNFVLVAKNPTHRTDQIEDRCYATIISLGGGDIKIKCRTASDTKRSSLAPLADSVQYAWKAGTAAPANETDGTTVATSTKATFILHTGTSSDPRKFYVFVRWFDTKHPELAGPWSVLMVTPIA